MSYPAYKRTFNSNTPLSVIYKSIALAGNLLNSLPDAVLTTDADFIITGINNTCEIIYGGPSDEIIGRNFFEVVKFDIVGLAFEDVLTKIKETGFWSGDVIYYNNDQKYYDNENKLLFNSSCSSIIDNAGNVIAYTFINKNISYKLHQEQELAIAETKYQTLIESLSEGVVMVSSEGSISAANNRAEEILGLAKDELSGKMLASPDWKAIKADGTEFKSEDFPAVVTLKTGREQNNVIMGILKPNGEMTWLSVNCRPIYKAPGNKPDAVVASFTEITDTIKANERYTYALKASSDAIWDMDMLTNTIYRSDNFTNLTGYTKDEIEDNLNWFMQKIHPEDRDRVQLNVDNCMNNKRTYWENEYRFKIADGTYRHLLDKAFAIYESGRLVRVIGGIQDMTKSKKLEARLVEEQVQKQKIINKATIQAQEKERNRISRELHDNVNQLLMSAKLHIGAAKNSEEDNTDLLEKAAAYILMAVEEIRGLSKELNSSIIANVGIQKSVDDIARSMKLMNEVELNSEISKDLTDKLSDEQLLMVYRIIQEQTNNIIKYSQCTQAFISLREKENNAILAISDNGIGFDKKNQQATGIGFINIFNRVDAHNGKVEIITSPGNGCTLQISFPVR